MTENDIFRALADPTRRAIFEKLADGAMNASALRDGMEISQSFIVLLYALSKDAFPMMSSFCTGL